MTSWKLGTHTKYFQLTLLIGVDSLMVLVLVVRFSSSPPSLLSSWWWPGP